MDLASLSEPDLIPQLVAQTLGLRLAADEPLLETPYRFSQPKQLLLILDNCEHLTESIAQFARGLLSHAPDLRILATSREVLGIAGEVIYPVLGLACPGQLEHTWTWDKYLSWPGKTKVCMTVAAGYTWTTEDSPW